MKPLTIGRLAQLAEVNVETIRYYQRIGLLNKPAKPASGFRHYPENTIEKLQFIKRAKQMGFSRTGTIKIVLQQIPVMIVY